MLPVGGFQTLSDVLASIGLDSLTADDLPIPGDWIVQGGAVGLLALVVLLILTGRLIPRAMYKELAEDRDYWRQVALKAGEQVEDLRVYGKITTDVVRHLGDITQIDAALSGKPPPNKEDG